MIKDDDANDDYDDDASSLMMIAIMLEMTSMVVLNSYHQKFNSTFWDVIFYANDIAKEGDNNHTWSF